MSDAATPCSCARGRGRSGSAKDFGRGGASIGASREGGHGLTSRERKERGHGPPTSAGGAVRPLPCPPATPRPPLRRGPPSVQPWRSTSPKTTVPKKTVRARTEIRRADAGSGGDEVTFGSTGARDTRSRSTRRVASNAIRRRACWGARVSDASLSEMCSRSWVQTAKIARDDPPRLGSAKTLRRRRHRHSLHTRANHPRPRLMSAAFSRASLTLSTSRAALRSPRAVARRASFSRRNSHVTMAKSSISSYLPSDTYNSLEKDGDLTFLHTMLRVCNIISHESTRAPCGDEPASPS